MNCAKRAVWNTLAEPVPADACPLDGDPASALASAGHGTDEDYFFSECYLSALIMPKATKIPDTPITRLNTMKATEKAAMMGLSVASHLAPMT